MPGVSGHGDAMTPDASVCPRCSGPLSQRCCGSCGLVLTGPQAARLWSVDVELAGLPARRQSLLAERDQLIDVLSRTSTSTQHRTQHQTQDQTQKAEQPQDQAPAEVRTRSAQNTLLAVGALLLAVAATVFGTVTYELLGATGRAVVLALLTLLALLAAPLLLRRGLRSTAEAAGAVSLALGALDAYGLRTLGLGADLGETTYAAGATGCLFLAAIGYDLVVQRCAPAPLRGLRPAALGLLQLTVLLSLAASEAGGLTVAVALAGLTVVDAAATRVVTTRFSFPLTGLVAVLGLSVTAAAVEPGPRGASVMLLWAGLAAAAARALRPGRTPLSALTVLLLAGAVLTLLDDRLTDAGLTLAALGVAASAVVIATRLPAAGQGTRIGSFLLTGLAVLTVAGPTLTAVMLPFATLDAPWQGTDLARLTLVWGLPTDRMTVGALAVLVTGTLVLVGPLVLVGRTRAASLVAPVGLTLALALAPFALALPYAVVPALLTVAAAVLLMAADRLTAPGRSLVTWTVAGATIAALATGWALADRTATLAVLPVLLAVAVTLAVSPDGATRVTAAGVTGLLLTGTVSAYASAAGLGAAQTGAVLVVVVASLVALAGPQLGHHRLGARREALEAAAAITGVLAVGLAAADPGWLSWTLAGLGLAVLAGALRPDRRPLAPAGALLLAGSSWVRLADANISAPEPYVVPIALLALVLGHLRRRQVPSTTSVAAYAPGLSLLLVPSLLVVLDDTAPTRGLLLAVVALAVLLLGARARLRAPLAFGAVALAVDAVALLAPYVSALPRWTVLAVLGAVLLAVGASYEQRRRDVTALRARFDALA